MKKKLESILFILVMITYFPLTMAAIIAGTQLLSPGYFMLALLGTILGLGFLLRKSLFPKIWKEEKK